MKLHAEVVAYWVAREAPCALQGVDAYDALNGEERVDAAPVYDFPVFYDRASNQAGHVVVLDDGEMPPGSSLLRDVLVVYAADTYGGKPPRLADVPTIAVRGKLSSKQLMNIVQGVFGLFTTWATSCAQTVELYGGFAALVGLCDQLVEDPIAVLDARHNYVTYSEQLAREAGFEKRYVDDEYRLPLEDATLFEAMPGIHELETIKGVFQYSFMENMLNKNLYHQDIYIGRVMVPSTSDALRNRYYCRLLEYLSGYLEALYSRMGSFTLEQEQPSMLKGMLSDALEGRHVNFDLMRSLLAMEGREQGDTLVVLQLRRSFATGEDDTEYRSYLVQRLENSWPGSYCITLGRSFVVLADLTAYEARTGLDFFREAATLLRDSLLKAGVSRQFDDIARVEPAYRQTEIAFDVGLMRDPMYWYYRFDNYAFEYFMRNGLGRFRPEDVCHPALLALRAHDASHRGELERTLKCYLRNGGNAARTAKELFVARSTLLGRLERVCQITRLDLDDWRERIYLGISFSLFEM